MDRYADEMTPEERQKYLLTIWRRMKPEERDYDRLVGKIPVGASWFFETEAAQKVAEERREELQESGCCSCHINPPCSYCVERADLGEPETINRKGPLI